MLTLQLIFWMWSSYKNNIFFTIIRYGFAEGVKVCESPLLTPAQHDNLLRAAAALSAAADLPWFPAKQPQCMLGVYAQSQYD